jgi:hypoxanthine-guanine phosphoribosyltransferase
LLDKQLADVLPEARFIGFVAPPAFLVGYGLDPRKSSGIFRLSRSWMN